MKNRTAYIYIYIHIYEHADDAFIKHRKKGLSSNFQALCKKCIEMPHTEVGLPHASEVHKHIVLYTFCD